MAKKEIRNIYENVRFTPAEHRIFLKNVAKSGARDKAEAHRAFLIGRRRTVQFGPDPAMQQVWAAAIHLAAVVAATAESRERNAALAAAKDWFRDIGKKIRLAR
jgi:hypothetical protein